MQTQLNHWWMLAVGILVLGATACGQEGSTTQTASSISNTTMSTKNLKLATFGSGCFWCTEAIYQQVEGVESVASGYSGGSVKNPSYREVCSGTTGHAEVIQIGYDPEKVSYGELLEIFWRTHDPTTLNRQGNDVGTQYRSVVFYHDEEQKKIAEASKAAAQESGLWSDPIVTEISPLDIFYKAEDYHQNYFNDNPRQPYCMFVVGPKVEKFQKAFAEKLKGTVK